MATSTGLATTSGSLKSLVLVAICSVIFSVMGTLVAVLVTTLAYRHMQHKRATPTTTLDEQPFPEYDDVVPLEKSETSYISLQENQAYGYTH